MKKESYRRIHSRYFYIIVVIAFGWIAILSTSGCGGGGGSDDYVTYCDPSQILFTYPENNETDVIGYRLILVEFTGLMNDSTINQSTFTIEDSGGNSVNGEVIFYDREICGIMGCYTRGYANFYPSDNLTPSTQYTATLSGTIQDEEGNDLGCDYHWSFTTRADTGTGTWQSISTTGAPSMGTAVWTGNEMILWDGASGGRYNPTTDTWQPISTSGAPSMGTAVWSGNEMIVWDGASGGRYNPDTDTWQAISTLNAPSSRSNHTALWTGKEMIVWGGYDEFNQIFLKTGGRYDPNTDTWQTISFTNAPSGRSSHTSIWTGKEMIVWGGYSEISIPYFMYFYYNDGGRYDPDTDTWQTISFTNAPSERSNHTAIWTGKEMIVWGGGNLSTYFNTGGRYDPLTDSWEETSIIEVPEGRWKHTAVWTGTEMIIWGGISAHELYDVYSQYTVDLHTGGIYNPAVNIWQETSTTNAPLGISGHASNWTGNEMIVWGGTGGRYIP